MAFKRGSATKWDRLFSASVQLIYEDEHGKQFIASHIADRGEFWWNPKRPDERVLWESKIELGEDFFNEIIQHPVPLDMNTLTALKRSSLGLDLNPFSTSGPSRPAPSADAVELNRMPNGFALARDPAWPLRSAKQSLRS